MKYVHVNEGSSTGRWFAPDGERVEVPAWHLYPHRWAGGAFTTDYGRLRRLVRVSRDRALVCAWGAYVPAAGDEPPFLRFGEVALMAFVTCGDKPAPPLVPGLGRWARQRYGFGFFPIMAAVTNRPAAELYRNLLGIPAVVADLRIEQRLDHERFMGAAVHNPVHRGDRSHPGGQVGHPGRLQREAAPRRRE